MGEPTEARPFLPPTWWLGAHTVQGQGYKGYRGGGTEKEMFLPLAHSPHGTTAKTRIPALHPGLPWQCQGPEHWAVLHCLGRAVSAKLRWEWSERGLSQLSHRRYQCCRQWLTPHVLMPALWPRIFARCLSSPSGTFLLPMDVPLRVFDQFQLLSVDQIPCLCGCSL